jgi:DNA-binding MarR family transcriptional regulator/GNAT superfamily N-acetyltransferase
MNPGQLARVRSFSRATTDRVGALTDDFLGRRRPLGEARVLWEIGHDGADVRDLRTRLRLDSGYMSRLLRALEGDGLVTLTSSRADGRLRHADLTADGVEEWHVLETRSEAFAASVLEPLSERQRIDLVEAMGTVERLLTASLVTIDPENPRSAVARRCLESYVLELQDRFDGGFDPARSVSADADELTPPAGLFLVARLRGDGVGCGALKLHGTGPAEIKRMWVSPSVRGLGVGRRILHELERHARELGARAARLETNRSLSEAISLYRSVGYAEVDAFNDEPYAHHWFEKPL